MSREELFNKIKENSIGSNKKSSNKFTKKSISKNIITTLMTVFIATSIVGCAKTDDVNSLMTEIEYYAVDEQYGYSETELKKYAMERLDAILEEHNLNDYTKDQDKLRDYNHTADEYSMINGLDDTYVYTFYSISNDRSVEEFVKGLGYTDFNDYLTKHNYLKEDGNINLRKWHQEHIINLAKIKSEEDAKEMIR